MRLLLGPIGHRGARVDDELRERRLDAVKDVVERFSYGLALLLAGQETDIDDCAEPGLSLRLRTAVSPFLAGGDALRPDFGAFGNLRVEGDLLAHQTPVDAVLEFDDRSFREAADGRLAAPPRRRVQLRMRIVLEPCRVVDFAVVFPADGE